MPPAPQRFLHDALVSDPAIEALFSPQAYVSRMLAVEAALAQAQASCGLFAQEIAAEIAAACARFEPDQTALDVATARDGLIVPGLVAALRATMAEPAASHLHHGATSQDILDTALLLQVREALAIIEQRHGLVIASLAQLADQHRATPMVARTRFQIATPTTFGVKVAGWLAPLLRNRQRLADARPRLLQVSCAGASGNMSALGPAIGPAVERALAERLGLAVPLAPWHAARDGLVELASVLALVTGGVGKIGLDLMLLAQSEVGEVRFAGAGGSSTMPHKANPVAAEVLIAIARRTAARAGEMQGLMLHAHERDGASWTGEWQLVPEMLAATGAALAHANGALDGLVVDAGRMAERLWADHGLALAEAVTFLLAETMPRATAADLTKRACGRARAEARPLIEVVEEMAPGRIDRAVLADPRRLAGASEEIIDRVLMAV